MYPPPSTANLSVLQRRTLEALAETLLPPGGGVPPGAREVDLAGQLDAYLGSCLPGIYRVSVAWQGMHKTAAPAAGLACGQGSYGDEKYRRVIAATVTVGTTSCF